MNLFNKLTKTQQKWFIDFFTDHIDEEIDINDVQSLDDFLGNLGFEIEFNNYNVPYWIYYFKKADETDDDEEYTMIYIDESSYKIWCLTYRNLRSDKPENEVGWTDLYFKNVNELMEYMR